MSDYLGAPRFRVTEIEGYVEGTRVEKIAVAVIDRAYCCQVIRSWSQENYRTGGKAPSIETNETNRAMCRREAAALAAELNAKHA